MLMMMMVITIITIKAATIKTTASTENLSH
jgi:hypothetical protein